MSKATVRITPKPREPIAITLKRFRKIVEREGIIKEIRKHAYYETKNQIRRRKKLKTIRRLQNEANNPEYAQSKDSRSTNDFKNRP